MMSDTLSDTGHTSPHNLEAERAILGAVLIDNSRWSELEDFDGRWFFRAAHAVIWRALGNLAQRSAALDPLTLCDELGRLGSLDEAGGPAYLYSLTDGVPRTSNVEHYAKIVRQHWQLRQLRELGKGIAERAYDANVDADDQIACAESDLLTLAARVGTSRVGPREMSQLVTEAFARLDERVQRPGLLTRGAATGFAELDELTLGWRPGRFVVIGGGTSVGKSSLALQSAIASAKAGHLTGVFSLEMDEDELTDRALAVLSGVDGQRMQTGFLLESDYKRLAHAAEELAALPLFFDDTPGITPSELRRRVRAHSRRLRKPVGVVILDYVQLAKGDGRHESRQLEVSDISRSLKRLANPAELNCCVIALAQFNRQVDGRTDRRPRLSDLRESGSLEQDADTVALLWRPHEEQEDVEQSPTRLIRVDVRKNRGGRTAYFDLRFNGPTFSFSESVPAKAAA